MKFTLEKAPFIRMLEMLQESNARDNRRFRTVTLWADRNRLNIQAGAQIAEIDSEVWEAGRCVVSAERLLSALKHTEPVAKLSCVAGGGRLRIGKVVIPATEGAIPRPEPALNACQLFFAASFGIVPTGLELAVR